MPKCFKLKQKYSVRVNRRQVQRTAEFRCFLKSKPCAAFTKVDQPCRNNVILGIPYCYMHMKNIYSLFIKESPHSVHSGKGVFAWDPDAQREEGRVFAPRIEVVKFEGEVLTREEMEDRYKNLDEVSMPYAIQISPHRFIDASCERGIASMINPPPAHRQPNVRFSPSRNNPNRIRIISTKNIKHGEELFVDHGEFEFQNNHRTYDCKFSLTWDRNY
jgi:hypothetical protein